MRAHRRGARALVRKHAAYVAVQVCSCRRRGDGGMWRGGMAIWPRDHATMRWGLVAARRDSTELVADLSLWLFFFAIRAARMYVMKLFTKRVE